MFKRYSFLLILSIPFILKAQNDTTKITLKPNTRIIEADFLSSYYQQEGNNAAVTGGIGTEQLTDIANMLIINIPIDSVRSVNIYGGADYYTSASTDKIDEDVSSASNSDVRGFGTLTYTKKKLENNETYSAKLGFSKEYDYTSFSTGFSYTKEWNDANSEITFAGQAFIDQWLIILPIELRETAKLDNPNRQSFNGQVTFSQILNKRMQLGLSAEAIYMNGLLSTPFHRVYFSDSVTHDIERLPSSRLKIPLSIRLNIYPFDNFVLRSYYRYYKDDFGINAHTFEVQTPIKIKNVFTLSPFYRYHTQTAANYFAPVNTHVSSQDFYSSDYDLSALSSHKIGLEVKYYPYYGLAMSKPFLKSKRIFMIKYLSLRGANYTRSTGLKSNIISMNIGFSLL